MRFEILSFTPIWSSVPAFSYTTASTCFGQKTKAYPLFRISFWDSLFLCYRNAGCRTNNIRLGCFYSRRFISPLQRFEQIFVRPITFPICSSLIVESQEDCRFIKQFVQKLHFLPPE